MIKHGEFSFTDLKVPDYWVNFASFGELIDSKVEYFDNYHEANIKLDPDKIYQMSFDQSSTNTGIFIKDLLNVEAHMIEVSRNKGQDAADYMWDLEMFINELTEGCKVSHIIYERPIKTESYRSAQVLFQLEGMLKNLSRRYTALKTAKVDAIENASWRSIVVDKSIERIYDRKEVVRISINDIYPWTKLYGFSLYKDEDIFESIGVMMGWFAVSFDPLGRPYVRGERTKRVIGGYCIPGLGAEESKKLLADKGVDSEFYIQNPRYSIYDNLAAMVEPYKTICVEFNKKYDMLCMSIECNIEWMDPDVMTVFLVDASTVDARMKEVAGSTFHFVL